MYGDTELILGRPDNSDGESSLGGGTIYFFILTFDLPSGSKTVRVKSLQCGPPFCGLFNLALSTAGQGHTHLG